MGPEITSFLAKQRGSSPKGSLIFSWPVSFINLPGNGLPGGDRLTFGEQPDSATPFSPFSPFSQLGHSPTFLAVQAPFYEQDGPPVADEPANDLQLSLPSATNEVWRKRKRSCLDRVGRRTRTSWTFFFLFRFDYHSWSIPSIFSSASDFFRFRWRFFHTLLFPPLHPSCRLSKKSFSTTASSVLELFLVLLYFICSSSVTDKRSGNCFRQFDVPEPMRH